jgi:NhaP-type Na+/H+ or K+/H+ antiporter
MLGVQVNQITRRMVGMPSGIISVVLAVLVIIVWIFLIRQFVYPRSSRRRAENLQLARLVYSGVLAVALVFVAEMLTLSAH